MNRLEQEIKKRLAQSTTMEGVDNEGLWNAISKTSYPLEVTSKKKRFRLFGLLLSLGAVGSILIFTVLNEGSSSAYSIRMKHPETKLRSVVSSSLLQNNTVVYSGDTLDSSSTPAIESLEDNVTIQIVGDSSEHTATDLWETESGTGIRTRLSGKSNDSSSLLNQVESNRQEEQKNLAGDQNNVELPLVAEGQTEIDQINNSLFNEFIADATPMQRLSPLDISELSRSLNPSKSLKLATIVPPVLKKTISWDIHGGAVLLQNKFKNGNTAFADSLNQNLSMELGYSIGGLVRIKQGKNWNVNVGMEYIEWNDRFDKVLLSDTLIQIEQGQAIGQNIRTVKHFNTASIITFPLQLEIYKDIERFRLGMNVGGSYSLILGQNGRLLKDNVTVVNYSQSEKRFTDFLSARFAPSVGFKLNEKVMVDAFCNFGFQGHGTNSINQLKNNSVAIMPSIGLTFNY